MINQFKALGRKRVEGQMNKTEAEHALSLKARQDAGEVYCFVFEQITFKLAHDLRYTPDFLVMLADGTIEFHEVKGAFITDDGRDKLKMAAHQHPWFTFKRYQKTKSGWQVTEIKA